MAEINGGNLYDYNKAAVANLPVMSASDLRSRVNEIFTSYCAHAANNYYMLLCNDNRDYTVFHCHDVTGNQTLINDIYDCLFNRGKTYSIELEQNGGIEIWMKIDSEQFCYYFFPYDNAVLES